MGYKVNIGKIYIKESSDLILNLWKFTCTYLIKLIYRLFKGANFSFN
jgi:hypothetical protein